MGRGPDNDFDGTERFALRRKLGAGGMGVVYEAFDREKGVAVALKTLRSLEARALYQLKQEFRAHQNLHHRNVVRIGELFEEAGQWFFTMELVRGVDFLTYVRVGALDGTGRGRRRLPKADTAPAGLAVLQARDGSAVGFAVARLRRATSQLAEGLAALHAAGKIHRDLKPSNILVTAADERVVILDFGLTAEVSSDWDASDADTVGTAKYMAPEQAAARALGPEADWYSVGVLLYEALTGVPPFRGHALEVMLDKQQREPAPVLSIAPSAPEDLAELCGELLRFDPEARPSVSSILARLGADALPTGVSRSTESTQSPPFVGRASELEVLQSAFAQVLGGDAVTVYVAGASGVGKSALIREFADTAREVNSAVVLAGRCYERESVPYKALDGVVDALSHRVRRLPGVEAAALMPRDAALLPRIFPVLGLVESIATSPLPRGELTDPHEVRRRGFEALRELLARIAERGPLVVIIDDLQWADLDSFTLIRWLMNPPDAPPLLLLVSAREASHAPGQTESEAIIRDPIPGEVRHLKIGTLIREDAVELARRLLDRAGIAAGEDAEAIAEEASGHPLYIDELVRHVATSELGMQSGARLDDAIWARVSQLPDAARVVLEIVCMALAPMPRQVIRRATRLGRGEFAKQVSLLRVASLARSRGLREHDAVEPYHDRVREAVRERLDEEAQRELHGRLAAALRSAGVADHRPELLVPHLQAIGRAEEAADYAESGARRAAEAMAFDRAVALFRAAVGLRADAGEVRHSLRASLANALVLAGHRADAAREFVEASRVAPAADALEYQRLAAESFLKSGHVDEGIGVLRSVMETVGLPYPRTGRQALFSALARRAWLRVRGLSFTERDTTQVSDEVLRRVDVCWTAAGGFGMVDTIRSVDYSTRHLQQALRAGERQRVARALAVEACILSTTGLRGARRSFRVLEKLSELAGEDPYLLGWVKGAEGLARYQLGEFRKVREVSVESEALFQRGAPVIPWEQSSVHMWHLWSLYHLGDAVALCEWVPQLLQDAEARGDRYVAANLCTGLPNAHHLFRDDADGARRDLDAHMARWSRESYHLQHYWQFVARQQIHLYNRDGEAAWATLADGWPALARSLYLRIPMVSVEAYDLRARCALAAATRGSDRARFARLVERDAGRTESVRNPASLAMATLTRAGAAFLRGDRAACRELLSRAIARARAADMALTAASARRRLGQVIGGDEGASLVREVDTWMGERQISSPARITALLAPGYD